MAHLSRVRVYPIKSLDGVDLDRVALTSAGTLAGDREYAIFADGEPLNGKRTRAVHGVRARYPEPPHVVTLETDGQQRRFDLREERGAFERWCESYFDRTVSVERNESGFLDRPSAGPSVVSSATLETVADWFDGLSVPELRRRLRANLEVDGVPAFWEDRFVGDDPRGFTVDGCRFEGVEPCVRCVVPERDSRTGERDSSFRSRFVRRRRETLPEWIEEDDFESLYSVTLIARLDPDGPDPDGTLAVGDPVDVGVR
jgi:uncharacterized protein YcbX